MATIGDQLTAPENGWRRYDDLNKTIRYNGLFSTQSYTSAYAGNYKYSTSPGAKITFTIFGSKLRIIGRQYPYSTFQYSRNTHVYIDGVRKATYSHDGTDQTQTILAEIVGLPWGRHEIEIVASDADSIQLDAVDIDAKGILGCIPATTGTLRTKIRDMLVGDYIPFHINIQSPWQFGFNDTSVAEIPLTGLPNTVGQSGYLFLIKVANGLLIGDRIGVNNVSWDALNTARLIQGQPWSSAEMDGIEGTLRSITGGVAYANAYGNASLNDEKLGAFPVHNEWDKYIVNFPIDKIESGKTVDDVFHFQQNPTWCQDTTLTGVVGTDGVIATSGSDKRTRRGYDSDPKWFSGIVSSFTSTATGFRPVFEYKEV
ncbi:hypothetical protein [Brevibacillus gelatini]